MLVSENSLDESRQQMHLILESDGQNHVTLKDQELCKLLEALKQNLLDVVNLEAHRRQEVCVLTKEIQILSV